MREFFYQNKGVKHTSQRVEWADGLNFTKYFVKKNHGVRGGTRTSYHPVPVITGLEKESQASINVQFYFGLCNSRACIKVISSGVAASEPQKELLCGERQRNFNPIFWGGGGLFRVPPLGLGWQYNYKYLPRIKEHVIYLHRVTPRGHPGCPTHERRARSVKTGAKQGNPAV